MKSYRWDYVQAYFIFETDEKDADFLTSACFFPGILLRRVSIFTILGLTQGGGIETFVELFEDWLRITHSLRYFNCERHKAQRLLGHKETCARKLTSTWVINNSNSMRPCDTTNVEQRRKKKEGEERERIAKFRRKQYTKSRVSFHHTVTKACTVIQLPYPLEN